MVRLVTVTGSRTNTLWHMLNHYKNIVDEMCIVVYEWEGMSTYDEVERISKEFSNVQIIKRSKKEYIFSFRNVTVSPNCISSLSLNPAIDFFAFVIIGC